MIGVGQADMDRASEAADKARDEVRSCQRQVNSVSAKVSEYESNIVKTQREIQETDSKISETAAKLTNLSKKREVVAEIQENTRKAVRQLGSLSGVGSVAEVQTRHLVQLEPVMKVMEEITSALGQMTGEEHTKGITHLMGEIMKKQNKLKQLADAKATAKGQDNSVDYY